MMLFGRIEAPADARAISLQFAFRSRPIDAYLHSAQLRGVAQNRRQAYRVNRAEDSRRRSQRIFVLGLVKVSTPMRAE